MGAKKYILIIVLIVIIGGFYFSYTYQSEDWTDPEQPEQAVESDTDIDNNAKPDDQFKDIKMMLYNKDSSIYWEIEAVNVERYAEKDIFQVSPVKIKALNEQDENLYLIQAEKGSFRQGEGELDLQGPILIKKDDLSVKVGELRFNETADLLAGQGGVNISSPAFRLNGESFEAEAGLESLTVFGGKDEQAYFSWKGGK